MNRIIGIGDIHLRSKSYYKVGFNQFLNWIDTTLKNEDKSSTEILIAGDILDKVTILPYAAALTVDFFRMLKQKAENVYVILGNHDYGLSEYKVINTKSFLEKNGVTVIDQLCEYTTQLGFKLLCLPWTYGSRHKDVNEFLKEHTGSYDVCTAHWELESLYGSDFVDLSNVQSKTFMCGHIHSHKVNPMYLGSILPNNIEELKTKDPSVLRVLSQDGKVEDINIPDFVKLATFTIKDLTDLNQLSKDPDVFYKVYHPKTISSRDIIAQAKILGLKVYGTEKDREELSIDFKSIDDVQEYKVQSHEDILNSCRERMQLTDEVYNLCLQTITAVS